MARWTEKMAAVAVAAFMLAIGAWVGDKALAQVGMPESGGPGVAMVGSNATFSGAASTCSDDAVVFDSNGVAGCQRTTDVAPQGLLVRPQPAFPGGTQSAAKVVICGGQDETTYTIADFAVCGTDTMTVTVVDSNGTSTASALVEGTNFTAATSNAVTATNLAAAIDALAGVSAVSAAAVVRISLDPSTCLVTTATSDTACATRTEGTPGVVAIAGNSLTGTDTSRTLSIISDANDAVTDTATAAITLRSSVNVTNGDLVLNVENSAGDNLFTVGEQGAVGILGLITFQNDFRPSTDNTGDIGTSARGIRDIFVNGINTTTTALTASTTVPALEITSAVTLDLNDLVLEVNASTGGTQLFAVDLEGDTTVGGKLTVTGTSTLAGDLYLFSSAATNWTSAAGIRCTSQSHKCGISQIQQSQTSVYLVGIADAVGEKAVVIGTSDTGTDRKLASFATGAEVGTPGTERFYIHGVNGLCDSSDRCATVRARTDVQNLAIGAAGATYGCAVATAAVTCSLGQHIEITPQQDDVAWDTGQLMAFCETANVVKVSFCGGSSADPADTNDYFIDVTTP